MAELKRKTEDIQSVDALSLSLPLPFEIFCIRAGLYYFAHKIPQECRQ